MDYKQEKQILRFIKAFPPILIIFLSIFVTILLYLEKKNTFLQEKEKIEIEYIKKNKEKIKEEVNRVHTYISYLKETSEKKLKEEIKNRVYEVHSIATTLFEKYSKTKTKQEMIELIRTTFKNYRYNGGRGYFFWDDENGVKRIYPLDKNIEGKNFYDFKDAKGYKFVHTIAQTVKDKTERFDEYYWYKPNKGKEAFRKISFYKYFEPLDLVIGTGEYYDEYIKKVQEEAFKYTNMIKYGKTGYIFIIDYNTIYKSHIREKYIGKSAIKNNDTKDIKRVIYDLINLAKKGDGYYNYHQNQRPGSNKASIKTSYVKGLNDWSILIGTGFYHDDLKKEIEIKKEFIDKRFDKYIINILLINFLLTVILIILSRLISNKISEKFELYKEELNKKQSLLNHNSKMASMGEMIGNIAHQWRQPLSGISTSSTGMSLLKEAGILTDEAFETNINNINKSAQYLSQTIEDFRNFFNVNKKISLCTSQDILKSTLNLISAQFHAKDIQIIKNIEEIKFYTYKNELIQALINILNNARDQLLKKNKYSSKYIFINMYEKENKLIIKILDNAGGIKEEIIKKIFEPYFTTKHKSQGTGIGLFMTEEIIMKHLKGEIYVKNKEYMYENTNYIGAEFHIIIDLKNKEED